MDQAYDFAHPVYELGRYQAFAPAPYLLLEVRSMQKSDPGGSLRCRKSVGNLSQSIKIYQGDSGPFPIFFGSSQLGNRFAVSEVLRRYGGIGDFLA